MFNTIKKAGDNIEKSIDLVDLHGSFKLFLTICYFNRLEDRKMSVLGYAIIENPNHANISEE
jgi:hypothetical protein